MAKAYAIKGLDEIERNLRKMAKSMNKNLVPAMGDIVKTIQRESMKRTPIDTGNLRGSHRSRVIPTLRGVVGMIYVIASYGLFVHEAPPSTKFKSPWPRGRKFLERAIVDNKKKILDIIAEWMKR